MFKFVSVSRISSGAKPNGVLIKDVQVEKNDKNWTISLLPANCGSPLPLLSIVRATRRENGNRDEATFSFKGLTSSIQMMRIQRASPPVRGTFHITYNGKIISGEC